MSNHQRVIENLNTVMDSVADTLSDQDLTCIRSDDKECIDFHNYSRM